jgi:NAD(P)-dependent dehydrogenase (short-subunit alcohol dehydrogenase family)/acyl carrier protein
VAADLVARGARHLVLLGRRGLPPRAEWAGLPPESQAAAGVALVRALERQGAQVRVEALDVSDGPRLAALLEELAAGLAPLRGVLHAAGVGHSREVSQLGPEDWAMVLPSKVAGAWQLDQALRGQQLDFVVYFSSAAAVWGSWGLGAYAVANGYLDALAQHQHARGVAALSVNWGRWAELGLAQAQAAAMAEQFEKLGLAELPTDGALELLWRLVGSGRAQATVAAVDWRLFQPVYTARRRRPFLDDVYKLDQAAETTAQARREPEDHAFLQRLEQAPPQERLELLTEYVQTAASAILGLDPREPLGAEQGFFQAGMDSVMSVELKQRLERSLGCSLPATLAFEQPSPAALADYLASQVLPLNATLPAAPASTAPHEMVTALSEDTVAALSEDQALGELAAELADWQAEKERL